MVSITKITPTRRVLPNKSGNKNNTNKRRDLPFERPESKDNKIDDVLPVKHIDERI